MAEIVSLSGKKLSDGSPPTQYTPDQNVIDILKKLLEKVSEGDYKLKSICICGEMDGQDVLSVHYRSEGASLFTLIGAIETNKADLLSYAFDEDE